MKAPSSDILSLLALFASTETEGNRSTKIESPVNKGKSLNSEADISFTIISSSKDCLVNTILFLSAKGLKPEANCNRSLKPSPSINSNTAAVFTSPKILICFSIGLINRTSPDWILIFAVEFPFMNNSYKSKVSINSFDLFKDIFLKDPEVFGPPDSNNAEEKEDKPFRL